MRFSSAYIVHGLALPKSLYFLWPQIPLLEFMIGFYGFNVVLPPAFLVFFCFFLISFPIFPSAWDNSSQGRDSLDLRFSVLSMSALIGEHLSSLCSFCQFIRMYSNCMIFTLHPLMESKPEFGNVCDRSNLCARTKLES